MYYIFLLALQPEGTRLALLGEVAAKYLAAPDVDALDVRGVVKVEDGAVGDLGEVVGYVFGRDPLICAAGLELYGCEGDEEFAAVVVSEDGGGGVDGADGLGAFFFLGSVDELGGDVS